MPKNSLAKEDTVVQTKLVPVYCIDTSSFINLKNFPQDIFPTIWLKLEGLAKNNQLISPAEVYREINQVKDSIYKWCSKHKSMFIDPDANQANNLQTIKQQYDKHYWDFQIQKTGAWADPWVIALGMSRRGIVVADESMGKNKIPHICQQLNVEFMDKFGLFRELEVKY